MNIPNIISNAMKKLKIRDDNPFKNDTDCSHYIIYSKTEDGNITQNEIDEKTKEELKRKIKKTY